ncbi:MAG: hypothetical protein Q9167_006172 [Letrouitia subvulpina]
MPHASANRRAAREQRFNPLDRREDYRLADRMAIFSSKVVTITTGPARTPFKVHEGLLLKHSEHFLDLVVGGRAQAQLPRRIHLRKVTPQAFRLVNFWLYTGVLTDDDDIEVATANPKELPGPSWNELVEVYIFAERKSMPGLQDACIELFIRRIVKSTEFPQEIISQVWQNTSEGSMMQRLIVDVLTRDFPISGWIKHAKRLGGVDRGFLMDLIIMYSAIRFRSEPEVVNFWEERAAYMVSIDEEDEAEEEQEDEAEEEQENEAEEQEDEPGLFVTPYEDDEERRRREALERPWVLVGDSDSEAWR